MSRMRKLPIVLFASIGVGIVALIFGAAVTQDECKFYEEDRLLETKMETGWIFSDPDIHDSLRQWARFSEKPGEIQYTNVVNRRFAYGMMTTTYSTKRAIVVTRH